MANQNGDEFSDAALLAALERVELDRRLCMAARRHIDKSPILPLDLPELRENIRRELGSLGVTLLPESFEVSLCQGPLGPYVAITASVRYPEPAE